MTKKENKVGKDQLIKLISGRANVDKKAVEDVLTAFESVVIGIIKDGKEAVLTGFGSFSGRQRQARVGVNPRNPSEKIQVPAMLVPKFKAGKSLKDALKARSEPEPSEPDENLPSA
jgi:DNA-binding protein HU-beta